MTRSGPEDQALRTRAEAVIPGGMYGHQAVALLPDEFPQFFSRAAGAHLWDVDGRRYLDLMCAYGPNLFGYANAGIDEAYCSQLRRGDAMTGPTGLIVDLAEAFTTMISHADWAIFCKNGTDATSMAMMTARAHTGRKTLVLARGAYHGSAPWCTPRPAGTTAAERSHQQFCAYNDIASLETAVRAAGEDLAAIFAAPFRHDAFVDQALPDLNYARRARELCDERDALLVVDDVRAGFRMARDCSWSALGVQPDLSTWGKCIANGHPISALLGSERARSAAASIYATGSFWFAGAAMAAALETLRLIRETDYLEKITRLGDALREGLGEHAKQAGVDLRQTGPVTMPLFLFDDDEDLAKGFAWSSAMLQQGVYVHPWHNMFLNAAMTEDDVEAVLTAAGRSFRTLRASAAPAPAKMAFRVRTRG